MRGSSFLFFHAPLILTVCAILFCSANIFIYGYDAKFYWASVAEYYNHFRTLLLYSILAFLSLFFFNKFLQPKEAFFYSTCLVLFNVGIFELPMQLMFIQNAILNSRVPHLLKNFAYQIFYVSFIVPLSVLNDREHFFRFSRRQIVLVIIIYSLLLASYFLVYQRNLMKGEILAPIKNETLDMMAKRFHVFSIKLFPVLFSILILLKNYRRRNQLW